MTHRVSLTQRDAVRLFQRVEVDSDAERDGYLISASIAATNRPARIVHSTRYVMRRQVTRYIDHPNDEVGFKHDHNDGTYTAGGRKA